MVRGGQEPVPRAGLPGSESQCYHLLTVIPWAALNFLEPQFIHLENGGNKNKSVTAKSSVRIK